MILLDILSMKTWLSLENCQFVCKVLSSNGKPRIFTCSVLVAFICDKETFKSFAIKSVQVFNCLLPAILGLQIFTLILVRWVRRHSRNNQKQLHH